MYIYNDCKCVVWTSYSHMAVFLRCLCGMLSTRTPEAPAGRIPRIKTRIMRHASYVRLKNVSRAGSGGGGLMISTSCTRS